MNKANPNVSSHAEALCVRQIRGLFAMLAAVIATAAFADNYYVDATVADNDYDGKSAVWDGTHGPKRDLSAILQVAVNPGDTVYLKPGRYASGTQRVGTDKTLCRGVVKSGVNLVALGTAAETLIVGESAPEAKQVTNGYGCGEDAVRCLQLEGSNVVKNVTLTDGRVYIKTTERNPAADTAAERFAAARCVGDGCFLLGCVLTNCVGFSSGCIAGGNNLTLMRCLVTKCRSIWHSGVKDAKLFNCIVEGVEGSYAVCASTIVNCTLANGYNALGANSTVYNSYVYSGDNLSSNAYYRSHFPYYARLYKSVPSSFQDNCKTNGVTLSFQSGTYIPTSSSSAVNAGNNDYLSLFPEEFPEEKLVDFYGKPRVANGTVDVGAAEYDWTAEYAAKLSAQSIAVAVEGLAALTDKGVQIGGGSSLSVTGAATPALDKTYTAFVQVTGSGVVKCYLDDATTPFATVAAAADKVRVDVDAGVGNHQVRFVLEGSGSAVLERFVGLNHYYVDAKTTDNAADGLAAVWDGVHGPKRDLSEILQTAVNYGDTVYLAPGDYKIGTQRSGTSKTLCRGIVKQGVNLFGLGAPGSARIVGEMAPTEKQVDGTYGCGEDAVRCLALEGVNIVRDVTLTDGRAYVGPGKSDGDCDKYSAVSSSGTDNYLVGCVITNCIAFANGTVAGSTGLTMIRCLVTKSGSVSYSGVRDTKLFNCVFTGNIGTLIVRNSPMAVNCTFLDASNGLCGNSTSKAYNSIVYSGAQMGSVSFYRSFAPQASSLSGFDVNNAQDDSRIGGVTFLYRRDTFIPKRGSDVLNAGNNAYLDLFPEYFPEEKLVDFYGHPRVVNGTIDVGAAEELEPTGLMLIFR